MTTTLLLVRHATSVRPTPGGPDDHTRPLAPRGLAEAVRLADELVPYAPAHILSSPYLRAVQTVQPTADRLGLTVEPDEELREWASGIGPTPDWEAHYRRCWRDPGYATGDGEPLAALTRRAGRALRRIAAEAAGAGHRTVVVASHGMWVSSALLGVGHVVDVEFWSAMPMPAVYAVDFDLDVATRATGPGL